MSLSRKISRKILWIFVHDVLAHPICGFLWIAGFAVPLLSHLGDWLHDVTVHPCNYDAES